MTIMNYDNDNNQIPKQINLKLEQQPTTTIFVNTTLNKSRNNSQQVIALQHLNDRGL